MVCGFPGDVCRDVGECLHVDELLRLVSAKGVSSSVCAFSRCNHSLDGQIRLTMTKVVVVLLYIVHEAFLGEIPFAELDNEGMPDVGPPQRQIRLDQVGDERVWVVCGRPVCELRAP